MSTHSDELEDRLAKLRRLEENLTFRFAIVNRILENQVNNIISEHGLNLTGYRVLRITEIFESISISDLSRLMRIDRAQISRSAVELEKMGLVEFANNPSNKRKKMVILSSEGQKLMDGLGPKFRERRSMIDRTVGEEALPGLWVAIENLSRLQGDIAR